MLESFCLVLWISFVQLARLQRLLQLLDRRLQALHLAICLLLAIPLKFLNSLFLLAQFRDEAMQLLLLKHFLSMLVLRLTDGLFFELLYLFLERLAFFLCNTGFDLVLLAMLVLLQYFLQFIDQLRLVNLEHWDLPLQSLGLACVIQKFECVVMPFFLLLSAQLCIH